jgi:hypothetical protein
VHDAEALVVTDDARHQRAEFVLVANEDDLEVGVILEGRCGRAHGNLGAEVTAHGIE